MSVYQFEQDYGMKFVDGFNMGTAAIVSDPCYTLATNCTIRIDNIMSGRWDFFTRIVDTGSWGRRVREICAINQQGSYELPMDELPDVAGVDSGMMSIFDANYFVKHEGQIDGYCAGLCDSACKGGVLDDAGCASSSGYGDGGYPVFVNYNGGGAVDGIRVQFIFEELEREYKAPECFDDITVVCSDDDDNIGVYDGNGTLMGIVKNIKSSDAEVTAAKLAQCIVKAENASASAIDEWNAALLYMWCLDLAWNTKDEPNLDTLKTTIMQMSEWDIHSAAQKAFGRK